MIEKIIKMDIKLVFTYCDFLYEPTVQGGLKGKVDIYLNDGTKIKNIKLGWENGPYFDDKRIKKEDGEKIIERLEEELEGLSKKMANKMCLLTCSKTFGKKFWKKFWVENMIGK